MHIPCSRLFSPTIGIVLVVLGSTVVAAVPENSTNNRLRVVALSGQQAPGADDGVTFRSFSHPILNNRGQTQFKASTNGNANGFLWSEGTGRLDLVFKQGDSVVGGPDAKDLSIGVHPPVLNDRGETAFDAEVGHDQWALINVDDGKLEFIARKGQQAPGLAEGTVFQRFGLFAPFSAGNSTFSAVVSVGGANHSGVWAGRPGDVNLIVGPGDPIPAAGPNVTFKGEIGFEPANNARGHVVFGGMLAGLDGPGARSAILRSNPTKSLDAVAIEGGLAPGVSGGAVFGVFKRGLPAGPELNDFGRIAFVGTLEGAGVADSNNTGIWSEGDAGLSLVAREGDRAPGTEDGVLFDDLITSNDFNFFPQFNNRGHTAFRANLRGKDLGILVQNGIWTDRSGELELVARMDDPAPGLKDGATYSFIQSPTLNARDQIAFKGTYMQDRKTGAAIWAEDIMGELQLIAREGGELEVTSGDFRTIDWLRFVNISDTAPDDDPRKRQGFNDLGQVAFTARFTDGTSGVFVSNLVAVPEPASTLLLALAIGVVGARRRRAVRP